MILPMCLAKHQDGELHLQKTPKCCCVCQVVTKLPTQLSADCETQLQLAWSWEVSCCVWFSSHLWKAWPSVLTERAIGLAGCAVCTEDINHAHIGFTCPLLPIASFAFAQLNCIVAKPHPSTMHDSPSLSPTSHPLSPMPTPPSLPYRRTAAIRAIAWHHSCQHLAVARCDGVIEIHHFGMQARTHTTLADHQQKNVTDMQWAWVAWVQIWIHTCDWWMKLTCNLYRCGLLFLMCRPHLHNILAVLSQEGLFVWSFDLESVRLAQLTWLSVPLLLA